MTGAVPPGARDEPWLSDVFTVGSDHPALAGHFPGNPIVPGVLVLERVLGLLESRLPGMRSITVAEAKFLRPLRAAEACAIAIDRADECRYSFSCRVDADVIARGTLLIDGRGG